MISKKIVEQAKRHYRERAFEQAHFQLATKSILRTFGIKPFEQGFYFAFNDQIFSLTSKFGNGNDGQQTVIQTAYVFCARYVNMLGSLFNLTICNKILELYSIPAYTPYIALEFEKTISLLTSLELELEIEKTISLLTNFFYDWEFQKAVSLLAPFSLDLEFNKAVALLTTYVFEKLAIIEEVYVNAFDNAYVAWIEYPPTPYLNDLIANYIKVTTSKTSVYDEGCWTFPSSAGSGTINSVKLRFEDYRSNINADDDGVTVYVWNGTSWINAGNISLGWTSYTWEEIDVSAILDSWAKINNAKVYLETTKAIGITNILYIRRCTRKVSYS